MRRALLQLDAELGAAIPRVVHASDDEAIHDLRVAIRRLRTLLKLARPMYGRFHADAVREGFTRVHRATGSLRDEEVLEETLAHVCEEVAELPAWLARRKSRERALRRAVVARIQSGELARARKILRALLTLPVTPRRDRPAHKLARKAIERARHEVESLRDTPVGDVARLHDLRIAYKGPPLHRRAPRAGAPVRSRRDVRAGREVPEGPRQRPRRRHGDRRDPPARGLGDAARADALRHLAAERAKKVAKYLEAMAPACSSLDTPSPEGRGPGGGAIEKSASPPTGRSRPS